MLVFGICPIIHKQLLAVLQGHVKFVYTSYLKFSTDFDFCRNPRKIFSQLRLTKLKVSHELPRSFNHQLELCVIIKVVLDTI